MKEIVYLSRVSPRIAYLLQKIAYSLLVNLVRVESIPELSTGNSRVLWPIISTANFQGRNIPPIDRAGIECTGWREVAAYGTFWERHRHGD